MTETTQVSPDAETLNPAPELTNETPEVVTPEAPAEPTEPTESEESKALKRMQRRIDKRTADVYRERAEKDQLAQRLTELERRLQPAEQEQPDLEKVVATKAQSLAQEIAQQQRITDSVGAILKAGKALANFDAHCNAVAEEIPFYENGRPTAFLSAVMEFDQPAQLLDHLGANPDLAAELADMTPTRRVLRLGAIERELTDAAKPKASNAPTPLAPVRGQGVGSKDPSAMTDAEFKAWRSKQIAQRR
jgi:hypothetical protein